MDDETIIDNFRGKYAFLSNFYGCPINYNGLRFDSVEAAYQAQKSYDRESQEDFVGLGPVESKKLGRAYPIRYDWDNLKVGIMRELLAIKFESPDLGELLMNTGEAILVEGNTWHNNFWGICVCMRLSCDGTGKNMLGELLMEIRDE